MLSAIRLLLALALTCALLSPSLAAQALPTGRSEFIFADPRSNPDKPVTAWCYQPATATRDSRVLFVMTGTQRNADDYRAQWIRHADRYNFVLVVPEFPRRFYPRDDDYSFAGISDEDPAKWGFSTLEQLFDAVRQRAGLSAETYSLYGHSAGAQFTHRLMLFKADSARVDIAVAANAGWYTLPVYADASNLSFPLILDAKIVPESILPRLFANRLIILLGDQDTDINSRSLNRSPAAMAQGTHRLARGQHFYHQAKARATALGTPFNWQLRVVRGVGHSDKGMSDAAVKLLFDD